MHDMFYDVSKLRFQDFRRISPQTITVYFLVDIQRDKQISIENLRGDTNIKQTVV